MLNLTASFKPTPATTFYQTAIAEMSHKNEVLLFFFVSSKFFFVLITKNGTCHTSKHNIRLRHKDSLLCRSILQNTQQVQCRSLRLSLRNCPPPPIWGGRSSCTDLFVIRNRSELLQVSSVFCLSREFLL